MTSEAQTIEAGAKNKIINLVLISFLSLYFELVIIRWLSSQIRIFAYFKNIPLLAAVFGLGLGLALANSKRDYMRWFPISLLIVSLLISFAEPLGLVHISFMNSAEFYLLGVNIDAFRSMTVMSKIGTILYGLVILVGIFYLLVLMFLGLGQKLGQAFRGFPPLVAYSLNVGASFVAILSFTGLSLASTKPEIWLLIGCALAAFYYYRQIAQLALLALIVAAPFVTSNNNVFWSPYYRIYLEQAILPGDAHKPPFNIGYSVQVNHDIIEGAYDNRPENIAKLSEEQKKLLLDHYGMMYDIIGTPPGDMLIIASGAGNDIAAALRHGATDIDAVEIDPVIVELGKKYHPEHPYSNPMVHSVVDDARAYLHTSNKKYDIVDYAYLDSGTAFSSMSSIRLDNYIYTIESFKDAIRLLKPGGVVACTFLPCTSWQQVRILKTMQAALGYEPLGVLSKNGNGLTFFGGNDLGAFKKRAQEAGLKVFDRADIEPKLKDELTTWDAVCPTTDDWPFLFLRERGFAFSYAGGLVFTLLIGWRLVGRTFGAFKRNPVGLNMFFLGAAFMLVEVKDISQMGLIVGTTWLVNAAVIGAILLMILIANIGQIYLKAKRVDYLYYGLIASLIGSYFLSLSFLNTLPMESRLLIGGVVLALPIFFASWIFAITFSDIEDPQKALGMNLLGTLVGGALEYTSMVFGIAALNFIAAILYGCAFYFYIKGRSTAIEVESTA